MILYRLYVEITPKKGKKRKRYMAKAIPAILLLMAFQVVYKWCAAFALSYKTLLCYYFT